MEVFAVIGVDPSQGVLGRIEERYPNDYLVISDDTFLIATSGVPTKDLAHRLGIGEAEGEGEGDVGIVIPVISHWGRHRRTIWDWIEAKRANR